MYIDIHTHAFHPKIAHKAVDHLNDFYSVNCAGDGTIAHLLERVVDAALEESVLLHQRSAGLPRVLRLPCPRRISLLHVAFRSRASPCSARLALGCPAAAAAADGGAALAAGGSGRVCRLAVRGVHCVELFILLQHARGGPVCGQRREQWSSE